MNHFAEHLKLTQYHQSTILPLKTKIPYPYTHTETEFSCKSQRKVNGLTKTSNAFLNKPSHLTV